MSSTQTRPITKKSMSYLKAISEKIDKENQSTQLSGALSLFQKKGIPTKKEENYKYTNLDKVFPDALELASPSQVAQNQIINMPCEFKAIFDNGQFQAELSVLPEGLSIEEVSETSTSATDPMESLNLSLAPKKYQVIIKKNTQIPLVAFIHRLESKESQLVITSLQVNVLCGSKVEIVEVFEAQKDIENFSLTQTKFNVESNAHVSHTKVLLTKSSHIHVGKVKADLERDAHFSSLTFSVDGKLNRNNVEVSINETGAHADVNGLYTGRANQHQDCFTTIHHKAAHTTSNQIFKGILDDQAHGVFTGKVIIHRDAQKVDSTQLNKNLLLSKKAHVDTRPQIEVYADDVKCGHGATVGQINQEEVFYLESRGIPKDQAQKILCHAFGYEAIESCQNTQLSKWLGEKLFELFEKFALEKLELN